MSVAYRLQDALGLYQTGAEGNTDLYLPSDSLAGVRLEREVPALDWDFDPTYVIPGIIILHISGACGTGRAQIRAIDADTLAFTAPDGEEGTEVEIAQGEARVLVDGGDPAKYVRVYRESANDLGGSAGVFYLYLVKPKNTALAMGSISSADRAAGVNDGRTVMLWNRGDVAATNVRAYLGTLGTPAVSSTAQLGATGAGTLGSGASAFADWPEAGFVRIRTAGGTLREVVRYTSRTDSVLTVDARAMLGTTAAAGASDDVLDCVPPVKLLFKPTTAVGEIGAISEPEPWNLAITSAAAEAVATLPANNEYVLWAAREWPAGGTAGAYAVRIVIEFTVSAVTYSETYAGWFMVADNNLRAFRLYQGIDARPDLTAAPAAESTTSPLTLALSAPVSGIREHRLTLTYRDEYGHESVNQDWASVELDSTGAEVTSPLQPPREVVLEELGAGVVHLMGRYYYGLDSPNADTWLLYVRADGTDPDPDTDTPVEVLMTASVRSSWGRTLYHEFDEYEYGTDLRVLLRVYRSGDSAESTNSDALQLTVGTAPVRIPAAPGVLQGGGFGLDGWGRWSETVFLEGTSGGAFLRLFHGEVQLWAENKLVWRPTVDVVADSGGALYIGEAFDLVSDAVTGTPTGDMTGAYEVASWTGGDKRIYIVVDGQRRVLIDVTNDVIQWASRITTGQVIAAHPNAVGGTWQKPDGSAVVFHAWDKSAHAMVAYLQIDSDGNARTPLNVVRTR